MPRAISEVIPDSRMLRRVRVQIDNWSEADLGFIEMNTLRLACIDIYIHITVIQLTSFFSKNNYGKKYPLPSAIPCAEAAGG